MALSRERAGVQSQVTGLKLRPLRSLVTVEQALLWAVVRMLAAMADWRRLSAA